MKDMARIRKISKIASEGGLGAVPVDITTPSRYETENGEKYRYDWYKYYDGIRSFYEWYED